MAKIICFGEVLGRLGTICGERLESSKALQFYTGGAEANVASLLARFGHEVKLVSVLPDGAIGDHCIGELKSHGVDTSGIMLREGRLGLYFTEAGAMMRPASVVYDRENSAFCEFDFAQLDWQQLLHGCDWLHISGITLTLGDGPVRAAFEAAQTAREIGAEVSFDCNYRASLWQGREQEIIPLMQEMVGLADCLFAGRRDARYLLDREIDRANASANFATVCEAYAARWPNISHIASTYREVLTVDHNRITGRYWNCNESYYSPSHDLASIVDRIGGGDAFAGGLLHQICSSRPDQEVIDFATASAVIKHSISGDINQTDILEISVVADQSYHDINR